MDDKTLPGSPSPAAREQPDLPVRPALPAHPEWREIVVPWGQKAPKVVQGRMVLPARRDPQDLQASPVMPEFPECPVYLVKWARPAQTEPKVRPARPERPARTVHPARPDFQARKAMREPMAPLAPLAPRAHRAMPEQSVRPAHRVLPVPSALQEKSAQEALQDQLAQLARMVPPDRLDQMVQLVQRARAR